MNKLMFFMRSLIINIYRVEVVGLSIGIRHNMILLSSLPSPWPFLGCSIWPNKQLLIQSCAHKILRRTQYWGQDWQNQLKFRFKSLPHCLNNRGRLISCLTFRNRKIWIVSRNGMLSYWSLNIWIIVDRNAVLSCRTLNSWINKAKGRVRTRIWIRFGSGTTTQVWLGFFSSPPTAMTM